MEKWTFQMRGFYVEILEVQNTKQNTWNEK